MRSKIRPCTGSKKCAGESGGQFLDHAVVDQNRAQKGRLGFNIGGQRLRTPSLPGAASLAGENGKAGARWVSDGAMDWPSCAPCCGGAMGIGIHGPVDNGDGFGEIHCDGGGVVMRWIAS
jgi:hypothetical protein